MADLIKVLIADDHRLFREGLRSLLHEEKSIQIVGEAVNGPQTISITSDLKPDIVLLDITMPEMNGIEVIPHIREKSPKTKTLMLTASVDEDTIFRALTAGAKGYISKDASVSDLIKAIQAVHRGELWVERKLVSKFFDKGAISNDGAEDELEQRNEGLSPREQEVLGCLTKGCTNKEIAEALFISEKTVKNHLHNIFRKLNITKRLEAIPYAIRKEIA